MGNDRSGGRLRDGVLNRVYLRVYSFCQITSLGLSSARDLKTKSFVVWGTPVHTFARHRPTSARDGGLVRTYLLIHSWAVSSPLHCRPAARPRAERVENNPDMHAALARLVNNEETRKQEKINQIPKRSSREVQRNCFGWL